MSGKSCSLRFPPPPIILLNPRYMAPICNLMHTAANSVARLDCKTARDSDFSQMKNSRFRSYYKITQPKNVINHWFSETISRQCCGLAKNKIDFSGLFFMPVGSQQILQKKKKMIQITNNLQYSAQIVMLHFFIYPKAE